MGKTSIEWATDVWNPVTGCTKISSGCKFCYAERITERWGQDFGKIVLHPDRLDQPLRWKKPRRIFVNSMSDLFHEDIPSAFIFDVFSRMAHANWHIYQILTKRAERMREFMAHWNRPALDNFDHIWLGVSCEDQQRADERIPLFVSLEPLLSGIDLSPWLKYSTDQQVADEAVAAWRTESKPPAWKAPLDWVIVGGESGGSPERALVEREWYAGPDDLTHSRWKPKAKALEWVRSIRDQCVAAGVPYFFKQWGGKTPKSGGRLLDGRTWDEYPK